MDKKTPSMLIGMSRENIGISTDAGLAKRLGMVRQTLTHKKKYPGTFTANEILAMAKLFNWSDETIGEFIRCMEK